MSLKYTKINIEKNTASFAEMSTTSRKLLTRIDAESYIRMLEERLSGFGVDVAESGRQAERSC